MELGKSHVAMITLTVLALPLLLLSVPIFFLMPLAFDAPRSAGNPFLWTMYYACMTYVVAALVFIPLGWILHGKGYRSCGVFVVLVSYLWPLAFLISLACIQLLNRGSFAW